MARYIDADKQTDRAYQLNFDKKISERELAIVNRLIAESPTEDVAPIVKAHWDLDDEETICSNCGTSFEGNVTVWKHCPSCGADTRGKDMQNNIMQHFVAALVRSGMSQEEAEAQVKKEFGE